MTNDVSLEGAPLRYPAPWIDYVDLSPLLVWLSTLFILVGSFVVALRWIIRRQKTRNPTSFAAAVLVQILFFLLFDTVKTIHSATFTVGIDLGVVDPGFWCLAMANAFQFLLYNVLVCLFSLAVVCLAARRLPRLPIHTLLPILVVLLDIAILLMWTTHVIFMRK